MKAKERKAKLIHPTKETVEVLTIKAVKAGTTFKLYVEDLLEKIAKKK